MRLIDADALFNWGRFKLSDAVKYGNKDAEQQDFSYGTLMMYEIAYEIDEAPTIAAVPVVRGYSYEDDKTYSGPGTSNYICSVCGEMQGTWKKGLAQNQKFKFCPWCGAKMEDKP